MTPIYKFELDGVTARPIYKDLTKDYEKQGGQEFFRAKLGGKLTFDGPDYAAIMGKAFDYRHTLDIYISHDAGRTWRMYWQGEFWQTDCNIDEDSRTAIVTPSPLDRYTAIMAGLEREYNLLDLLPEIVPLRADKRPMIQIYVPGQSVIGCFLSGMWWEQECEVVNESDTINIGGQDYPALTHKYHFYRNAAVRIAELAGGGLPDVLIQANPPSGIDFVASGGGYTLTIARNEQDPYNPRDEWSVARDSDGTLMWYKDAAPTTTMPYTIVLSPASPEATGDVELYVHDMPVYARLVLDVETIAGNPTYPLPEDDLVGNNRNYHRAIGYAVTGIIHFSTTLVDTPTQWGIYQPGRYYQIPYLYWQPELFPVSRNGWGRVSVWFAFSGVDAILEEQGRAPFVIKDTYPLASVISVLLGQIAPGVTHEATTDYSLFLYGQNPLNYIEQTLLVTPKSNIVSSGYDQPAQKAMITLRRVTDMLRDCFRCYWWVDDDGRFRIEHISYFMRGGTYTDLPVVGIDLTSAEVTRNCKAWAFGLNRYDFDKPTMPSRYEFGWMDDTTDLFDGYPIDILSGFVNPENIERVEVSQFTSDIDYILLNPSAVSKDGFALLAAKVDNMATPDGEYHPVAPGAPYRVGASLVEGVEVYIDVELTSTASTNMGVYFTDASDAVLGLAGYVELQGGAQTATIGPIVVPGGAAKLMFAIVSGTASVKVLSVGSGYVLPYVNFRRDGTDHILQNGYAAFAFLQQYYAYDMPAPQYSIRGEVLTALGVKRYKLQQIRFPSLTDPDTGKLIKTGLGSGAIDKLSVNLPSRSVQATLRHDTQ